jgi:hypothetical protein
LITVITSSIVVSQVLTKYHYCGIFSIMARNYEYVGEVRSHADDALASHGLTTAGGSYYPYTQSLVFGVRDENARRAGDVYCQLPGGWTANTYWPDQANPQDGLRFKSLHGVGRLLFPLQEGWKILEPGISPIEMKLNKQGQRSYQLVNRGSELMIVHSQGLLDPSVHTDMNRPGANELEDDLVLHTEKPFTHSDVFDQSSGSVTIDIF